MFKSAYVDLEQCLMGTDVQHFITSGHTSLNIQVLKQDWASGSIAS